MRPTQISSADLIHRNKLFDFVHPCCYIGFVNSERAQMKKFFRYLLVIFGVALFDQIVKWWILNSFLDNAVNSLYVDAPFVGDKWNIIAHPMAPNTYTDNFFNVIFTWNPGTSFSFFQGLGESAPIVIIIVTAFVIGLITYYLFRRSESYERLPLAFIIGGALGNLIDRLRYGAVIDFLDFHIGSYSWPAFNVADVFICLGVGLYILNWLIARRRSAREIKK